MEWLREVFAGTLTGLLGDLLLLALTLAAAYGVRYVRLLTARLEEQSKNELANAAIRRVGHLAEQVILAIESTSARSLRQAVADGKVERAELEALGGQAVQEVLRSLDAETRVALEQIVGDVRSYIRREVEARLESLKAQGVIPRLDELKAAEAASAPK